MKKTANFLFILLSIILPLFLLMCSVRILLNPFYLDYEYNLAAFPPDEFGFSTADRLNYGKSSLEYLTNNQGIEFLANLKFPNGDPLYNERELSHMLDVKILVKAGLKVWYVLIAFILLLALLAWRKKWLPRFWKAVSAGGWATLGLILLIIAATFINFDKLFADFHAIFFTGDTWLFYTSDSLIRLFPEKLWSDAFLFVGIFTLIWAVLCIVFGSKWSHSKQID